MIGSDPKLSVSEFVGLFNQTLEETYPFVDIVGEVANFRISKNRWVYFDLQDEFASVKFFGSKEVLTGPIEDGMSLEVLGYPRLHNRYGLSINISNIQVVGEGSIAKAQALLAKKLEQEGLFKEDRKRPLIYPPERIGLITSGQSAAYADFVKILKARWPHVEIVFFDSLVQGIEAPLQIVSGINKFNQMTDPVDSLVIIRGGGSADDLAAFSTEQVVRAVAASRVPTLVAIGHEIDLSLAELAADMRASTPSNAAELLVPDQSSEQRSLKAQADNLKKVLSGLLADKYQETDLFNKELAYLVRKNIDQASNYVESRGNLLRALDPTLPLKKGYALVLDKENNQIKSAKSTGSGQELSIRFHDGKIKVKSY